MKTVSIIAQKGGVGKTTLSINFAVTAERKNLLSVIIDLDPQGSSYQWGERRSEKRPEVISAQAINLPAIIEKAKSIGMDRLFVDTPPHSTDTALQAAKMADLIIVPVKPSLMDLDTMSTTFDLALLAGKKAVAVINMAPPIGTLGEEAERALLDNDYQCCPIKVSQRNAFVRSLTEGKSAVEGGDRKAVHEIEQLYQWIESEL